VSALAVAATAAALAWLYLLTGHGGFWRTDQRLPAGPGARGGQRPVQVPGGPAGWPAVTAVIPARDEASVLPLTLPTLLGQDYPGPFELILVDDQSRDGTAAVATALAVDAPRKLIVVGGAPPPSRWAGKVWAMEQGVRAAGSGEYLLFTDADIAFEPGTVTALVAAALTGGRDLISQMALLRAETRWERALVPAFVYFFAQLYPFRWVNRPGGRTAAAAGGCMLVRAQVLADAGGLGRIRGALIDDVALGRLLKRPPSRARCWLGFTTQVVSRRPYPRLAQLWDMVARSAYTQLRYSPVLLAVTVVGLLWLYLVPPAAALTGLVALAGSGCGGPAVACAIAGLAGWTVLAVTYLPVLRLYRLAPLRAVTLPLIALMYAGMTVDSARRHWAGRGGMWKGRISHAPQRTNRQAHPAEEP
jgi:hopene-associated glycosyltransferase HpnB